MSKFKNFPYVVPVSAGEEDGGGGTEGAASSLEDLLAQMDGGGEGDGASEGNQTPPDDAQNNQTGGDDGSGNTQQNQNNQSQQHSQDDKRNFAFGQMRTQINELTALLGKVATANGIEFKDNKELISKLTDDTINRMAQKQNVPVELLREVEALRQDSQAFKQQQLREAAAIGFQQVMDTYKLTQEQLQQFAVELDQKGKNPFNAPVDIMAEYKLLHYDDILKMEVERAVEAALKRDGAATQNSSTPNNKQGGAGSSGEKITTVSGLSQLLNGVK